MRPEDLEAEIGDLADLGLPPLRQRWYDLYGREAPRNMSRQLLRQAIAYRLQEQAFGDLSRPLRMRLAANGFRPKSEKPSRNTIRYRYKPGTRFLREWQGRTHEVTATEDGRFEYRGTVYKSLSSIAREITGTRWSGPAFFGLRKKKSPSSDD